MPEYIERETAVSWFIPYAHAEESIDADVVISDIKGMKAADVAPVRHGRWVPTEAPFMNECEDCSVCGYRTVWGHRYNYCSNCGAKMGGGDSDEAD